MGYENKIDRLLGDSNEKMRNCVIAIYQHSKDEYYKLKNEFQTALIKLMDDYSREKFDDLISKSYYESIWKTFSKNKKKSILDKIEPILLIEKQFSDHIASQKKLEFVFLETNNDLILYGNGMYAPMNNDEDRKDTNQRLRFALKVPSITISDNDNLNKYAEENEKFPLWLSELTFLDSVLNKNRKIKP